eukprot:CFRG7105T1
MTNKTFVDRASKPLKEIFKNTMAPSAATLGLLIRTLERGFALTTAYILIRRLRRYGLFTTTLSIGEDMYDGFVESASVCTWIVNKLVSITGAHEVGWADLFLELVSKKNTTNSASSVQYIREPTLTYADNHNNNSNRHGYEGTSMKTKRRVAVGLPQKGLTREELLSTLVKLKYNDQTLAKIHTSTLTSTPTCIPTDTKKCDSHIEICARREENRESQKPQVAPSRNPYRRGTTTNTGAIVSPSRNLSAQAPRCLFPAHGTSMSECKVDGRVWELYGHERLSDIYPKPSMLRMESDLVSMLARAFCATSTDIGGFVTGSAWDTAHEVVCSATYHSTSKQMCRIVLIGECHRSWALVCKSLGVDVVCIPITGTRIGGGMVDTMSLSLRQHLGTGTVCVVLNPFTNSYNTHLSKGIDASMGVGMGGCEGAWAGKNCSELVTAVAKIVNNTKVRLHLDLTEYSLLYPLLAQYALSSIDSPPQNVGSPSQNVEGEDTNGQEGQITGKHARKMLYGQRQSFTHTSLSNTDVCVVKDTHTNMIGFNVKGVTSVSVSVDVTLSYDTTCAVVYRDRSYRPTCLCRPGVTTGAVAAAWGTIMSVGVEGYSRVVDYLMDARTILIEGIREIDGLDISLSYIQSLTVCIHAIPFTGEREIAPLDMTIVGNQLNYRSWLVDIISIPIPHIRVTLGVEMVTSLNDFLHDLSMIVLTERTSQSNKLTRGKETTSAVLKAHSLNKVIPRIPTSTSLCAAIQLFNKFTGYVVQGKVVKTPAPPMVHPGKEHLKNDFVGRRLGNVMRLAQGAT